MFLSTTSPDLFGTLGAGSQPYPDLKGKRVLLTGVTSTHGVDIARAFAEHGVRLAIQFDETGCETDALAEVLAPDTQDLAVEAGRLAGPDAVVTYARRAASLFGGLDVVVNFITLSLGLAARDQASIERRVSEVLTAPCLIARIAANRMRLLQTAGQIIHVAVLPEGAGPLERAFAGLVRATLAAMTRADATSGAADQLRVNAIAPSSGRAAHTLNSEPDVAALVLHLAAGRSPALSGLVFDAAL